MSNQKCMVNHTGKMKVNNKNKLLLIGILIVIIGLPFALSLPDVSNSCVQGGIVLDDYVSDGSFCWGTDNYMYYHVGSSWGSETWQNARVNGDNLERFGSVFSENGDPSDDGEASEGTTRSAYNTAKQSPGAAPASGSPATSASGIGVLCDWYDYGNYDDCQEISGMEYLRPCPFSEDQNTNCDNEWHRAVTLLAEGFEESYTGCAIGAADIDIQDDDCGLMIVNPGAIVNGEEKRPPVIAASIWEGDEGLASGDWEGAGFHSRAIKENDDSFWGRTADSFWGYSVVNCLAKPMSTKHNREYVCGTDNQWHECVSGQDRNLKIDTRNFACESGVWKEGGATGTTPQPPGSQLGGIAPDECKDGAGGYVSPCHTDKGILTIDDNGIIIDVDNKEADPCSGKKLAFIGASNTVKNSHVNYLEQACHATYPNFAVGGATLRAQIDSQLKSALKAKPNLLIVSPSGNTCGYLDEARWKAEITKVIMESRKTNSAEKVVFLSISPRNYKLGGKNVMEACVNPFNKVLKGVAAADPAVIVVDLNPILDPNGDGTCDFCAKGDQRHWNTIGDARVAAQILNQIFGTNLKLPETEEEAKNLFGAIIKGTASGAITGQAPTSAYTTTSRTERVPRIIPGCVNQQRCKEIDEAWNKLTGAVVRGSSDVWDTVGVKWNNFDGTYFETKSMTSQVPVGGPGGTTISSSAPVTTVGANTGVQSTVYKVGGSSLICGTQDTSMSSEQKAFLDMIAWAEGTTAFAIKDNVPAYQIYVKPSTPFYDLSGHPYITGEKKLTKFSKGCTASTPCSKNGPCKCSSAAGRYQFLSSTWTSLAKKLSLPDFKPESQDKAGWDLVESKQRVSLNQIKSAKTIGDWTKIADEIADEWASIRYSPKGTSFYGQGNGKTPEQLKARYEVCLDHYKKQ